MLKSLAQLLVATIPTTGPAPGDRSIDIATLACEQFIEAPDRTRTAVARQLGDHLAAKSPSTNIGEMTIEALMFRLDLACLETPQASVLQAAQR